MNAFGWLCTGDAGEPGRRAAIGAPRLLSARWLAMVVAALLSLTVQSFVVQTHVHLPSLASEQTRQPASLTPPLHHRAHPQGALDCPGCRQFARAASVMLPPAIALIAPTMAVAIFASPRPRLLCEAQRSHRWRSRGPPPLAV